MTTESRLPSARSLARALVLTPAFAVLLASAPAFAAPPERWEDGEPISGLNALLILVGAPLALFAVICLLVYVPSMARGERYTPGLAWRNANEWFGGPRGGVEAADSVRPPASEAQTDLERGGASAHW